MPQKTIATQRTTASSRSKTKKQPNGPWLKRVAANKYSAPGIFVLVFISLGVSALYWVSAATTTYSLWSSSTIPKVITVSDTSNVELGLKFRASVAGYVTGVRFYKGAQNTGTHTGNLWDDRGNLLASVKFLNESANGWQSASFTNPVSIAANVTYVVSYHAPNGRYSLNSNYFSTRSHSNKYLTALANIANSPNGVYVNSTAESAFPIQSGNGANYWVDVTFTSKLISPQPAPAAPTNVVANAGSTSVALSWQASASANAISKYTVYRDGNMLADVGTALTYTDSAVTTGTTYGYQVQATDNTGQASALSTVISVAVPSLTTGGGTSTTTCPLPKFPDASCTGVPASATLTTVNGDVTITKSGTVIDGQDIHGCVDVQVAGVTIKNSRITCPSGLAIITDAGARTAGAARLTVQDTQIICGDTDGSTALGDINLNAFRLNISKCENGFDVDSDADIEDSYIHDLHQSSLAHTDGLQSSNGTNVTINHNTFYANDGTSAININNSSSGPHTSNATVSNNLLAGGAYTLYCPIPTTINVQIINNHFSNIFFPKIGQYGPSSDCGGEVQSGNVYQESGVGLVLD